MAKQDSQRESDIAKSVHKLSLWRLGFIIWPLTTLVITLLFIAFFVPDSTTLYADKTHLQKMALLSIANGADLSTVKHILKSAPFQSVSILTGALPSTKIANYTSEVTVDQILNDLKVLLYTSTPDSSGCKISRIDSLIKENNEVNPFEGLNHNQRYFFENVRQKTGNLYSTISGDLNNISSELVRTNQLVNEYLSDATWSFRISIAAIVLSIATAIMNFFQFRRSRKSSDIVL
jgi:hypothetical protein